MKFVTELPPAERGKGSTKASRIISGLMARPGEWAIITEACYHTCLRIQAANPGFTFAVRASKSAKPTVYGRYLP